MKFRSSGLVSSVFTLWAIFCFSLGPESVVEDFLWLLAPNATRTEDWVAHGNSMCHLGYGVQLFGQTPVLIFQGKYFSGEINIEINRMLCVVLLVVVLVMISNSLCSCDIHTYIHTFQQHQRGSPWASGPLSFSSQTPTASALTFKAGHGHSHYYPQYYEGSQTAGVSWMLAQLQLQGKSLSQRNKVESDMLGLLTPLPVSTYMYIGTCSHTHSTHEMWENSHWPSGLYIHGNRRMLPYTHHTRGGGKQPSGIFFLHLG